MPGRGRAFYPDGHVDLAGEAKAAVVSFAHVNYDPFSAKLGVKAMLLATFAANKRRV